MRPSFNATPMPPPKRKKKKKKKRLAPRVEKQEGQPVGRPLSRVTTHAPPREGGPDVSTGGIDLRPKGELNSNMRATSQDPMTSTFHAEQQMNSKDKPRLDMPHNHHRGFSRFQQLGRMKKKNKKRENEDQPTFAPSPPSSSSSELPDNKETKNPVVIEMIDITSHSRDSKQGKPMSFMPERDEQRMASSQAASEIMNSLKRVRSDTELSSADLTTYITAAADNATPIGFLMSIPWFTLCAMTLLSLLLAIAATSAWGVIISAEYPGKWVPSDSERCCVWQAALASATTKAQVKHDAVIRNIWVGHFMQFLFGGIMVTSTLWFHQWLHQAGLP